MLVYFLAPPGAGLWTQWRCRSGRARHSPIVFPVGGRPVPPALVADRRAHDQPQRLLGLRPPPAPARPLRRPGEALAVPGPGPLRRTDRRALPLGHGAARALGQPGVHERRLPLPRRPSPSPGRQPHRRLPPCLRRPRPVGGGRADPPALRRRGVPGARVGERDMDRHVHRLPPRPRARHHRSRAPRRERGGRAGQPVLLRVLPGGPGPVVAARDLPRCRTAPLGSRLGPRRVAVDRLPGRRGARARRGAGARRGRRRPGRGPPPRRSGRGGGGPARAARARARRAPPERVGRLRPRPPLVARPAGALPRRPGG